MDAEAIREKRLRKLQQQQQQQPPPTATATSMDNAMDVDASNPSSPIRVTSNPRPTSTGDSNPSLPAITPVSKEERERRELNAFVEECLQCRFSVDAIFRPLLDEWQLPNADAMSLDVDALDQLLLFCLNSSPFHRDVIIRSGSTGRVEEQSVAFYLVGVWSRCCSLLTRSTISSRPHFLTALDKLRELCISYTGLVLQMPHMFPCQSTRVQELGPLVLVPCLLMSQAMGSEHALQPDFIQQLLNRFHEPEEQKSIFGPLLLHLAAEMRALTISKNFIPTLAAFQLLVSFKPLAQLCTQLPSFNPRLGPRAMEVASLLGPLFRLTTFGSDDPQFAMDNFGQQHQRTRQHVDSVMHSYRLSLHNYHEMLYQICMSIIRSSPQARDALLDYMAYLLKINQGRTKMHIQDPKSVSTEGFMSNWYRVLLRLCDPLMDASISKLNLIDAEYLSKSARVDVESSTKLNPGSPDAEKEYYAHGEATSTSSYKPNFVTEIFFLTVQASHVCLNRTITAYTDHLKHIRELQQALQHLQQQRPQWQNSPLAARNELLLKRLQDQQDRLIAEKFSWDVQVLDGEGLLRHAMGFQQLVLRFVMRVASCRSAGVELDDVEYAKGVSFTPRHRTTGQWLQLPLTHAPPTCFGMYPEFFLEDAMELLLQVMRFQPEVLYKAGAGVVMEYAQCIVMFLRTRSGFMGEVAPLTSAELSGAGGSGNGREDAQELKRQQVFIKNPYLVAKMVEVLFSFTWDYGGGPLDSMLRGIFGQVQWCKEYLAAGLIAFYVDVEKTGLSSQFYDKFGIRYNITQILKVMWKEFGEVYRPRIKRESDTESTGPGGRWETFVKFVNLIMNDTTYLLDESLGKLNKIKSLQVEMDDPVQWSAVPDREKEEKMKQLQELERQVTSLMQLGNETVLLLSLLTTEIHQPFLRSEIVDRLAAMLDYNLVQLVGPKCQELKVRGMETLGFKPRDLLRDIMSIYTNLGKAKSSANGADGEFAAAVARDGRSYDRKWFDRALEILESRQLKSPAELAQLRSFIAQVEAHHSAAQQQSQDLGDVPDEFLDPLMFDLMTDPVILPSSKVTVDRSTIMGHLLSDSTDPFNRAPLRIEDVVENVDLKKKIEAWIVEKKGGKM